MAEFTMPSLGADMDEGTLLEWRVSVGDHVTKGDIVAVIDTEKSTVEVEVFETGTVDALLVEPGVTVPVGTPLARIRADGDAPAPSPPPAPAPPAAPAPVPAPEPEPEPPEPAIAPEHHSDPRILSPVIRRLADRLGVATASMQGTGPGGRITRGDVELAALPHPVPPGGSSPLARSRATDLEVDLGALRGSGPGGAILERDVLAARAATSATPPSAPQPTVTATTTATASAPATAKSGDDRRAAVRQAIARRMSEANRDIPHYHLSSTVDLRAVTAWLAELNADRPPARRLLPAAVLLRATALAADRHPELNGWWTDGDVEVAEGVHLGVAVSLRGGGLIAPVIHHAEQLGVDETMDALRDLVARSRQGSLRASELSGASLTVTNLGDRGAEAVFGVIYPPQVALVGFGRIVDRPVAVDGLVGVHPTVVTTLSGDHRASDGMAGSAFLATLGELLADPTAL